MKFWGLGDKEAEGKMHDAVYTALWASLRVDLVKSQGSRIKRKMQEDVVSVHWRSSPLVFTSVCVTALELSNNSLMSLCSLQAGPHSWHHEDGHHIGCAVTRGGQGSQQHAPGGQWRAISRTVVMITPRSCHCANRHKPIPDIIMGIT